MIKPNLELTKQNICFASLEYREMYLAKVQNAINAYITWMNENVSGYRFITRWWTHMLHGHSGRQRALDLQRFIRDPENDFYDIVKEVGNTYHNSGYTQNSFKRYLFEHMTGSIVVDTRKPLTFVAFQFQSNQWLVNEMSQLVSLKQKKQDSHVPAVEYYSAWSLTQIVLTMKQKAYEASDHTPSEYYLFSPAAMARKNANAHKHFQHAVSHRRPDEGEDPTAGVRLGRRNSE